MTELKGGSNPFKNQKETQYAKDQKAIRKLNKPKPKKKGKKQHSKNYRNIQVNNIEDFFEPPKKLKPIRYLKPTEIKDSMGESIVGDWLRKHNLKFIREKKFAELTAINGTHLRMDFYLPDLRMCIEFDGKQHFQYSKRFDGDDKGALAKRQFNDNRKNKFCEHKGLRMLRIKYNEINNIASILCKNCL